ncbi:MAG TPA: hypothetical protein VGR91_13975, partial [Stellaceae bacterium]|nr:hypothetical protein [Stellaceae bacterium]
RPIATHAFWWPHAPIDGLHAGARLAVALPRPAVVRWGVDGWQRVAEAPTRDSGLGFQLAVLEVADLPAGGRVDFTWHWQEDGSWQGRDYSVAVLPADAG